MGSPGTGWGTPGTQWGLKGSPSLGAISAGFRKTAHQKL